MAVDMAAVDRAATGGVPGPGGAPQGMAPPMGPEPGGEGLAALEQGILAINAFVQSQAQQGNIYKAWYRV